MIKQHYNQQCDGSTSSILTMQFDGQTPPLATQQKVNNTNNVKEQ
jgi:hypothetical protein